MNPFMEEELRKSGKHPGRITSSSGSGNQYLQPYKQYMDTGVNNPNPRVSEHYRPMSEAEFKQNQQRMIKQFVEGPVRPHVQNLIAKGKVPFSSNAYGPGPRGVEYRTPTPGGKLGPKQFLATPPPSNLKAPPPPPLKPGMVTGIPNVNVKRAPGGHPPAKPPSIPPALLKELMDNLPNKGVKKPSGGSRLPSSSGLKTMPAYRGFGGWTAMFMEGPEMQKAKTDPYYGMSDKDRKRLEWALIHGT